MSDASRNKPLRDRIGESVALATPFDAVGGIDWARFSAHADRLLAQGMEVVTAFGTTGEGASIDPQVRARLFEEMGVRGIAPARVATCVYGNSPEESGRDMARALEAGAAAILLEPPFYYTDVSNDGVYRWFSESFESAGSACRDVILYNIPQLTGVTIGPELVSKLREAFPQVVAGVKDSGGDWDHTASLIAEHKDLAILVGHEGHLARAVRLGASGTICGIGNFAPELIQKLARGEDDPRIDVIIGYILANPVVPALKALLAAQLGEPEWARVKSPLVEFQPDRQLPEILALASQNQ
jgi:4-hydroxy-tetrahydrodipicolinate synthase